MVVLFYDDCISSAFWCGCFMRVVKAILGKSQTMLFLVLLGNFARKRMFDNNLVDHGGIFCYFFYPLRYLNSIVCYSMYFLASSLSTKYCFLPYPVRICLICTSVVFLNVKMINLISFSVISRKNIYQALPLLNASFFVLS